MIGIAPSDKRRRYREVASALTRHGLGALSSQLGLLPVPRKLPFRRTAERRERATTAEHLRLAIEEMGTTAIKLGQILSTRPDLVPPTVSRELEKLRDHVPAVPTEQIMAIVEEELGRPIAEVFADFEQEPLAAASIGQVYGATLLDGTRVVVKVRKPGIEEAVSTDLAILSDLARRANRARLLGETYDAEALADEFSWTLRAEMDYVREGRNADRFRTMLADEPDVIIPRVHWQFVTRRVLVMDRVEGIGIADLEKLDEACIDRARLARRGAELLMKQVFDHGFFHADPHPGNFFVLPGGRIALVDFGMVGELGEDLRRRIVELLASMVKRDAVAMVDCLEDLGVVHTPSIRSSLSRDIQHLLERYYGLSVSQFGLMELAEDIFAVVRHYGLQLPAELTLVLKTLAMSEGLWRQLDPEFNLAEPGEPIIRRAALRMYLPQAWAPRARKASNDAIEMAAELPGQVRRLVARLDRGEFEVTLHHKDIEEVLERTSRMVTRLAVAIVVSALLLGLPLLATVYEPPGWKVLAPIWFVFGIAVLVGLVLRLTVWDRRGSRRRF